MIEIKLNNIYCMDNVKGMGLLPDCFIDLTVTSPPYDKLRKYNEYCFDFENVARQLYRTTKEGGVVVWVIGDATIRGSETGTSLKQALFFMSLGFRLHDTMIYEKTKISFPEVNRYYNTFEYMYVFSKGKPKTVNLISDKKNIHSGYRIRKTCGRNPDGSYQRSSGSKKKKTVKEFGVRTNIWKINSGLGTSDRIAHKHPAIFPEQLAEDHIISWSNEKDIVLDPFMGSGTTAVSAIRLKRNYIGFDVSEEYCEIAERRILDITCQ